jgi:hypothetical protein
MIFSVYAQTRVQDDTFSKPDVEEYVFTSICRNWWWFVQLDHYYLFLGFHIVTFLHILWLSSTGADLQFPAERKSYRVRADSIA